MQQLGQKRGQVGLLDAAAQQRLGGGQLADVLRQHVHQLGLRVGPTVGQGALEMIPDGLVRVRLGGVPQEGDRVVRARRSCTGSPRWMAPLSSSTITWRTGQTGR